MKVESPETIFQGYKPTIQWPQTGVVMAELLGIPHATIIMQDEKTDSGLRCKREGRRRWFSCMWRGRCPRC